MDVSYQPRDQTYIAKKNVTRWTVGRSTDILRRDVAWQVRWQGADNGKRSQTRDGSEGEETHCDQIENRKCEGNRLECLWLEAVTGHIYTFRQSGQCTVSTSGESMLWVLAHKTSSYCHSTVTPLIDWLRISTTTSAISRGYSNLAEIVNDRCVLSSEMKLR